MRLTEEPKVLNQLKKKAEQTKGLELLSQRPVPRQQLSSKTPPLSSSAIPVHPTDALTEIQGQELPCQTFK